MAVTIKINPCPERYNSANPYKTGQTTSYATNDDGDLERGRGSDFTTLDFNNPFGNTNRFTDTTGGQTYANDIVIDWSTTNYINETVIGWYRVVQGGAGVNWATAMAAQPYTIGSYNDWYVPNVNELATIVLQEQSNVLDYSPFNLQPLNGVIWSTSTRADNTGFAKVCAATAGGIGNGSKTNNWNFLVLRYFTFTELGL